MNEAAINIDLTDLQEIMDKLPDPPPGSEKRQNALTKSDVLIIAQIVRVVSHKSCAMGFTQDEITTVKRVILNMNRGILVVGYSILTAIGAGMVSLIWWSVKHGLIEVAKGPGK